MGKRYNRMSGSLKRASIISSIDVVVPIAAPSGSSALRSKYGLRKSKIVFRTRDSGMQSRPLVNFDGLKKLNHYTSRTISMTVDSNGMGESDDPAQYVSRLEADPRYAFFDDIMDEFAASLDSEVDATADMLVSMITDDIMSGREFNASSIHDRMDRKAIGAGVGLLYSARNHIAYTREPQVEQNWKRHYKQSNKVKTYGAYRVKGGTEFLGTARNLVESGDLYNALTVTVKRGDGKIVEVIK